MTAPLQATGQRGVNVAEETPPQLDYSRIRAYWKGARPSMLGPYMMNGFGFPAGAGRFRFRGELKAVAELIQDLGPDTSVLDLGSGVGIWTEYFADRFASVVAVEASPTLYAALKERCSPYPNVTAYNRDVLTYDPTGECRPAGECRPPGGSGRAAGQERARAFGLVFLGGLLMYLNDRDVRALLHKLTPCLEPGAIVLCRESTVRHGVRTLQGDYQVAYRSVEAYRDLFTDAGFDVVSVQPNRAYINVQMACELVKKWKALVPQRVQCLPIVGRLAYWGFRLGYPWNTRLIPWLLTGMGREFPSLMNHFFVLRPSLQTVSEPRDAPRGVKERLQNAR